MHGFKKVYIKHRRIKNSKIIKHMICATCFFDDAVNSFWAAWKRHLNIYIYGNSVSRLEGFVSNREQSYEDPIEE